MITDEQIQNNLHTDFEREFARQALNSEVNVYTQAERDALTPEAPQIVFNSDTLAFEAWDGAAWGALSNGALEVRLSDAENNIGVNSLRDAVNGGYAYFNMVGGVGDVYTDETGVDVGASTGLTYNAANDYYTGDSAGDASTLLIQSNTTDGSTTFVDAGGAKTITVNGDVQHDTDQSQFGSSAILFDGTGDYLTLPDSEDWNIADGSYSIDFWMRPSAISVRTIMGQCSATTGASDYGWCLRLVNASRMDLVYTTNGTNIVARNFVVSLAINTWYHVAMTFDGAGNIELFIDGTSAGTFAYGTIFNSTRPLAIGGNSDGTDLFAGHLDEIRIVKGSNLFPTNFTPPTVAYSALGFYGNMDLRSIDFSSGLASVSYVRPVVLWEPVEASTLNTDFIFEVSRDSGTTWEVVTLEADATFTGAVDILIADEVDITGQPAGATTTYRVRVLNDKNIRLHGVYLQWR